MPGYRLPWRQKAGLCAIGDAAAPPVPSRGILAAQLQACRTSASYVSPLAPRSSSHCSLARMAISCHQPPAGKQSSKQPSIAALNRLSHETDADHDIKRDPDSRAAEAENQCWSKSSALGRQRKEKKRKKRPNEGAEGSARQLPTAQSASLKSEVAAPGRQRRAPDAADAFCRLPERPDLPDPWSPRRRRHGRSSRHASGRALPHR